MLEGGERESTSSFIYFLKLPCPIQVTSGVGTDPRHPDGRIASPPVSEG